MSVCWNFLKDNKKFKFWKKTDKSLSSYDLYIDNLDVTCFQLIDSHGKKTIMHDLMTKTSLRLVRIPHHERCFGLQNTVASRLMARMNAATRDLVTGTLILGS